MLEDGVQAVSPTMETRLYGRAVFPVRFQVIRK